MTVPIQNLKAAGYHTVMDRTISKQLWTFTVLMKEFPAYQDSLIIRLMSDAQLRKGRAFTANQIIKVVKPGQHREQLIQHATSISQIALQRGYTLTCPNCAITGWYSIGGNASLTSDQFQCNGCHQSIDLPFDIQFAYKLNPLVREAVKNGGLTILNALVYLTQNTSQVYNWHTAVEVKNRQLHTDIDLLLFDKDSGVFVECKDKFKTSDAALDALKQTIDTGMKLAETLNYEYVLATLQEDVPVAIREQVEQGDGRVLTSRDLLTS